MHTKSRTRRLRLASGFDTAVERRASTEPLWKAMGVDRSVLSRVRRGQAQPGSQFIAGALTALAPARFEDLFEVVPAEQ